MQGRPLLAPRPAFCIQIFKLSCRRHNLPIQIPKKSSCIHSTQSSISPSFHLPLSTFLLLLLLLLLHHQPIPIFIQIHIQLLHSLSCFPSLSCLLLPSSSPSLLPFFPFSSTFFQSSAMLCLFKIPLVICHFCSSLLFAPILCWFL